MPDGHRQTLKLMAIKTLSLRMIIESSSLGFRHARRSSVVYSFKIADMIVDDMCTRENDK
eukprot:6193891-Pleurochrysis_carterae.AAC.1